jgi:uncharacterized membrane protein
MDIAPLFALIVAFLLWLVAAPHVMVRQQRKRLNELERRLETAERALTLVLEEPQAGREAREETRPSPRSPVDAAREAAAPAPEVSSAARSDAAQEATQPQEEAAKPRSPWPQSGRAVPPSATEPEQASPPESEPTQPDPAPHGDWRTNWPGAARPGGAPPRPAPPPRGPRLPSIDLEQLLGARWSVLVGGAALALGALLLVRYSIEAGLIGPGLRVLFGLMLGAGLIGAGEWTRRRATPAFNGVSIPATLTGAGIMAIFAALYAAHALYGFIGPATAFALLGATGVGAMLAAALHGPILAALGLIGSFVTPVLVHSNSPSPWALVIYLLIVTAAAQGVARLRRMLPLGLAALGGATIWQILLSLEASSAIYQTPALAHGLAQTALALAVFVRPFVGEETDPRAAPTATLAPAAIALATLFAVLILPVDSGGLARVAGGVALVALVAGGGALANAAAPLAAVAGGMALAVAGLWPQAMEAGFVLRPRWTLLWSPPLDERGFLAFALLAGGAVAAAAFLRLKRGAASPLVASIHAGAFAATPTLLLALAYARVSGLDVSGGFAVAAGALAALFVGAAVLFLPQADADEAARQGLGFSALGALGALAVGLAASLNGGSLTVAWALTALAAAWLAARLDLAALRWGVVAMGALVAARLAWEPRIMRDVGTTPILNWLLVGYGVPALAFAGAARLLRARDDLPLQVARGCAVALAGFLVFFEVRHAMNGGDIYAHGSRLAETGLHAFSATMFALALTLIGGESPAPVYRWATAIAGALAGLAASLGLLIYANPIFTGDSIGEGRVVNALVPGYLLPALGATALAIVARRYSATKSQIAAAAALLLLFAFVTLATRALFHGAILHLRQGVTPGESLTYSAAWLALGLAALAYGVARRSKEARMGSAVFVVLATVKVFLFDLAGLTGAWRAFSFIGLGLVLIGIGAVYQRLLFPQKADGKDRDGL